MQIIWIADSWWKLVHQLTGPRWAISAPLASASKLLNTNWTAKSSCNSPYGKYYFSCQIHPNGLCFGFLIFDARSLLLGCVRQLHRALQSDQWGAFQFHFEELGDGLLGNGPEGALMNGISWPCSKMMFDTEWILYNCAILHIKFKLLSRFFHFKTCRFFVSRGGVVSNRFLKFWIWSQVSKRLQMDGKDPSCTRWKQCKRWRVSLFFNDTLRYVGGKVCLCYLLLGYCYNVVYLWLSWFVFHSCLLQHYTVLH